MNKVNEWSLVNHKGYTMLVPAESELIATSKMIAKIVMVTKETVSLYGIKRKVCLLEDGRKVYAHWTRTLNKLACVEDEYVNSVLDK